MTPLLLSTTVPLDWCTFHVFLTANNHWQIIASVLYFTLTSIVWQNTPTRFHPDHSSVYMMLFCSDDAVQSSLRARHGGTSVIAAVKSGDKRSQMKTQASCVLQQPTPRSSRALGKSPSTGKTPSTPRTAPSTTTISLPALTGVGMLITEKCPHR